jgi:hypothetical protein
MDFLSRLTARLNIINEENAVAAPATNASWKDPSSPDYDRQYAEDCLYHTIGPLTNSPRWAPGKWTSKSQPPEGWEPNGPAPRWTEDELTVAMAGDPNIMWTGKKQSGNPRSPYYGHQGGSPVLRSAIRVAKQYNKLRDPDFILDLYQNGLLALSKLMQPGYDASYKPFISFAKRHIEGAMAHGTGSTLEANKGGTVLRGILEMKIDFDNDATREPVIEKLKEIIAGIGGVYRQKASHDKNPENPYGQFSSKIYDLVTKLIDAVGAGDAEYGQQLLETAEQLLEQVEDEGNLVLGASTGVGQAISTGDRETSVGIVSADTPASATSDTTIGQTLPGAESNIENLFADKSAMAWILEHACKRDLSNEIKNVKKLEDVVSKVANTEKMSEKDVAKALRPFTANMWRYCIRCVGKLANPYYGEGQLRSALKIPRDAAGWWKAGEDPEIDQASDGTPWESEWRKGGREVMEMPEIAREMGREVNSLSAAGIATARAGRVETDSAGNPVVLSTQAVNMTVRPAIYKLYLLAALHELSDTDYFEESKLDAADRLVIAESAKYLARTLQEACNRGVIAEMKERIKAICG